MIHDSKYGVCFMYNAHYIESINNALNLLERHASKIIRDDEATKKKINYAEFRDAVNKAKEQGLIKVTQVKPGQKVRVPRAEFKLCHDLWEKNLSRDEIARITGFTKSTVASRVSRYKKYLRSLTYQ